MVENKSPDDWKQNLPDIYFDGLQITTTVLGVTMILTLSDPTGIAINSDEKVRLAKTDLAVIRTSPAHAKLISMLLRRQLKRYEEDSKTVIQIPEDVYRQMGLDPSDW